MNVDYLNGPFELPKELEPFFEATSESSLTSGGRSLVYKGLRFKLADLREPRFVLKYGRLLDHKDFLRAGLSNEFSILRSLNHPAFPRAVYGFFDGEMPWSILRDVGIDLFSAIRSVRLVDPEIKFKTMRSILEAIAHFHSLGMIHCDLKPENIGFDSNNDVHILDFDSALWSWPYYLQYETTPEFAPPEQGGLISFSHDVYQLGLLAYCIFAERIEIDYSYLTQRNHRSCFRQLAYKPDGTLYVEHVDCKGCSDKISKYLQEGFRFDLGNPGLEDIVAKATRKDPSRRYQNAGEMLDAFLKVTH